MVRPTGAVGAATGTILFSTSTVAGGNSNNNIVGNDIAACAGFPTKGVMGLGSATAFNSGNLISDNNIFDFFNPAISVSGISVQR